MLNVLHATRSASSAPSLLSRAASPVYMASRAATSSTQAGAARQARHAASAAWPLLHTHSLPQLLHAAGCRVTAGSAHRPGGC